MTTKQIATNQAVVACDVCGRTLLRGELPAVFLAGGSRRDVCELCTPRAAVEGWIREGVAEDTLGVHGTGRERRGSLLGRLRSRRGPAHREEPGGRATALPDPSAPERPAPGALPELPREPRTVHAIPTNADMKRARAVDLFNGSEHPRRVAALERSLGAPFVVVRPSDTEGSIVTVVVGWELCWYRYEVDLADEAAGVRQTGQGDEFADLPALDQVPNAAATERGALQLVEVAV